MPECPYCKKSCEARGLKNHIRLASDAHGPRGEIPDDFEGVEASETDADDAQADAEEAETDSADESEEADSAESEAVEVVADDLGETTPETPDESDDGDDYPFDPDSDDAIELDGDENLYVSVNGSITEATPSKGDYLLITDSGPILWDHETNERYEVITA